MDPATDLVLGPTVKGYNLTYRLDPREAIVILAQMPPPAAYFSLQSYLFTREGTFDTESTAYHFVSKYLPNLLTAFFSVVPRSSECIQRFASLSNSVNNVVDGQSGEAFDQVRDFIIAPERSWTTRSGSADGLVEYVSTVSAAKHCGSSRRSGR